MICFAVVGCLAAGQRAQQSKQRINTWFYMCTAHWIFSASNLGDDYTRECLALVADTSISGIRVARELDRIVAVRGRPGGIVSDNGTELTSTAILAWSDRQQSPPVSLIGNTGRQLAASRLAASLRGHGKLGNRAFNQTFLPVHLEAEWRCATSGQW
jgi:transposase InsO family protein